MAAKNTTSRAGFRHNDFGQHRQLRFQLVPNPYGNILAGGIFEAGNFVEVTVVELFPNRFEGGGNIRVIHDPAEFRVAISRDGDLHLETVPVQSAAFVGFGQSRQ